MKHQHLYLWKICLVLTACCSWSISTDVPDILPKCSINENSKSCCPCYETVAVSSCDVKCPVGYIKVLQRVTCVSEPTTFSTSSTVVTATSISITTGILNTTDYENTTNSPNATIVPEATAPLVGSQTTDMSLFDPIANTTSSIQARNNDTVGNTTDSTDFQNENHTTTNSYNSTFESAVPITEQSRKTTTIPPIDKPETPVCISQCPDSHFYNVSTMQCDTCHETCYTCSGKDKHMCDICKYAHNGECFSTCPYGLEKGHINENGTVECITAEQNDQPLGLIIGLSVGAVALIAIIVGVVCFYLHRRRKVNKANIHDDEEDVTPVLVSQNPTSGQEDYSEVTFKRKSIAGGGNETKRAGMKAESNIHEDGEDVTPVLVSPNPMAGQEDYSEVTFKRKPIAGGGNETKRARMKAESNIHEDEEVSPNPMAGQEDYSEVTFKKEPVSGGENEMKSTGMNAESNDNSVNNKEKNKQEEYSVVSFKKRNISVDGNQVKSTRMKAKKDDDDSGTKGKDKEKQEDYNTVTFKGENK